MTRSEDAVAAPPMPRERGSRDDILRRERGPAVGREEPAHEGVQRVLNAGRVAIDERCEPAAPVAREERDEPRARAPCQPAGLPNITRKIARSTAGKTKSAVACLTALLSSTLVCSCSPSTCFA